MRRVKLDTLVVAALIGFALVPPVYAEIEAGGAVKIDACASDPTRLGVSRVVEINTAGGANIGGTKPSATHFLNDGEVVLTFDDGPARADTQAVLKALADQCTKATFFMVGSMALADPSTVRDVSAAGHTIGTHTWSHANLRYAGLPRAQQEIERAVSMVSKVKGSPVAPLFRFPYLSAGRQSEDYLKSRNIGTIWVDIDSKDYLAHDPKIVEQRILAQLATEKKGIILMHDIHAWTAKMLPDLLKELHDRGLKVVHLVPKGPAQTVPSYDDAAEKALSAKTAARNANPLAERSMVWTMSPGTSPSPASKQKGSLRAKKIATKPSIAEGLPNADDQPPSSSGNKKTDKAKGKGQLWPLNFFAD
jgi:peptidoglycan/xylan/chitin deacetylase (PgdA/CDA1 family)